MKIKNLSILLLAILLVFSLCACGGSSSSTPASSSEAGSSKPEVSEAEGSESAVESTIEAEEDDEMEKILLSYDIDFENTAWQGMLFNESTPTDELQAVFEELEANAVGVFTYTDVAEIVGMDAQQVMLEGNKRAFRWNTDDRSATAIVWFEETDGKWLVSEVTWREN